MKKNEFEIAEKDLLGGTVNYYDFQMPKDISEEGWRLPNLEELREIFLSGDGNFKNDWYMTSEFTNDYKNMCVHYGDRREVLRDVTESHWGCSYIRLVRDK
jgi:hypothetical protein